jgi:hypothetical protein
MSTQMRTDPFAAAAAEFLAALAFAVDARATPNPSSSPSSAILPKVS